MDRYQQLKSEVTSLIQAERWNDALSVIDELITLQPENYVMAYNRGLVHWKLGELLQAETWLCRCLELQPNDAQATQALQFLHKPILEAWHAEGKARMEAADWPGALNVWTRLCQEAPQEPRYLFLRGIAHSKLGELETARTFLQQASALTPDDSNIHAALQEIEQSLQSVQVFELLPDDGDSEAVFTILPLDDEHAKKNPADEQVQAFHKACITADVDSVRAMLDMNPALVNAANPKERKESPLHAACRSNTNGDREAAVVSLLISHGADINATDENGYPAYFCNLSDESLRVYIDAGLDPNVCVAGAYLLGSVYDRPRKILTLLDAGANPTTTPSLLTDICYASANLADCSLEESGYVDVVGRLLSLGCDPNWQNPENGWSVLHTCVERRQRELADLLLQHGANVNCQDHEGATPLHFAVTDDRRPATKAAGMFSRSMSRKYKLAVLLLQYGADATIQDNQGCVPQDVAINTPLRMLLPPKVGEQRTPQEVFLSMVMREDIDGIRDALNNSPELVNATDCEGATALHYAAQYHMLDIATVLLDKGAAVDRAGTEMQRSPVHFAVLEGDQYFVHLLIQRGASIHVVDQKSITPLHVAALNGYEAITTLLINSGANRDATSINGVTPLHFAIFKGQSHIVSLLMERGIDLSLPAYRNLTPLHCAAEHEQPQIIADLVEKYHIPVTITQRDDQVHPIHVASICGKQASIATLLRLGESIEARDRDGFTPLHYAILGGHSDIIRFLVDSGADIHAVTSEGLTSLDVVKHCDSNQDDVLNTLNELMRSLARG